MEFIRILISEIEGNSLRELTNFGIEIKNYIDGTFQTSKEKKEGPKKRNVALPTGQARKFPNGEASKI